MGLVRKWLRQISGRWGSVRWTARAGALLLVMLCVLGGVWLIRSGSTPGMQPLLDRALPEENLVAAQDLLTLHGIAHRQQRGRLLVPPGDVAKARGLLAEQGLLEASVAETFERLSQENDIWRTEMQSAKRWQAVKMATLSRLIRELPSVRSATVIFEPGSPRTLGRKAVEPTAAVKISLRDGRQLTSKVAGAVADLVAGSIAGMERRNVRIVDDQGHSYRPGSQALTDPHGGLEALWQAETHYTERILQALHYVGDVVVGVHVEAPDGGRRRITASVAVPRSYLAARRGGSSAEESVRDDQVEAVAQTHLPKIQQIVMGLIGATEPADVKVNWYHDARPGSADGAAAGASPANEALFRRLPAWSSRAMSVFCLAAACLALAVLIRRRRLRRQRGAEARADLPGGADVPLDVPEGESTEPLAFLGALDGGQLAAALRAEDPRTVALVLANVSPEMAATVLASQPQDVQVQVVRQLAGLEDLDEEALREAQRGLAQRIAALAKRQDHTARREEHIAEMLQQAGLRTERNVLDGLVGQEPALAGRIRDRMFAFEDISRLSPRQLRYGLELLESDELAVALRTAGKEIRKKVFASLSSSAVKRVRQEMDQIGPVRLSDVEAAQQRVVEAIRQARHGRYVSSMSRVERETPA